MSKQTIRVSIILIITVVLISNLVFIHRSYSLNLEISTLELQLVCFLSSDDILVHATNACYDAATCSFKSSVRMTDSKHTWDPGWDVRDFTAQVGWLSLRGLRSSTAVFKEVSGRKEQAFGDLVTEQFCSLTSSFSRAAVKQFLLIFQIRTWGKLLGSLQIKSGSPYFVCRWFSSWLNYRLFVVETIDTKRNSCDAPPFIKRGKGAYTVWVFTNTFTKTKIKC